MCKDAGLGEKCITRYALELDAMGEGVTLTRLGSDIYKSVIHGPFGVTLSAVDSLLCDECKGELENAYAIFLSISSLGFVSSTILTEDQARNIAEEGVDFFP